jgi:hypothetical protein
MGMSKQEAGKLGALKTKLLYKNKHLENIKVYDTNPIICKQCNLPHLYEKRNNKFCSISCATTFNNLLKVKKQFKCLNCDSLLKGKSKKYCGVNCQTKFNLFSSLRDGKISPRRIKKHLIEKHGNKCWTCGITDWNNKKIVMELEHIDGNSENNNLENLSILCPNCHSQTITYKGANKGNGRFSRRLRYAENKSY